MTFLGWRCRERPGPWRSPIHSKARSVDVTRSLRRGDDDGSGGEVGGTSEMRSWNPSLNRPPAGYHAKGVANDSSGKLVQYEAERTDLFRPICARMMAS